MTMGKKFEIYNMCIVDITKMELACKVWAGGLR